MTKPRNIKLKHTMLIPFLLYSLLSSVKNMATEQSNNETNSIKTVTKKILGEDGYLFGFSGNIIDWIGTSIYNHYTEHNLRKEGLYYGKYYIYGGKKIKITKNVYLDVYYSFLKLIPYFIIDIFIYGFILVGTLFAFITININIHIYKNFYLAIAPMSLIFYNITLLSYDSERKRTNQEK